MKNNGGIKRAVELLKESMEGIPTVKKGDYLYFIHPLTDGVPFIEPPILEAVTEAFKELLPEGVERIVTVEAMGIPMATSLSLQTGIPFTIVRKRSYGLEGERKVVQVTGYSRSNLYINGLEKGMRVVIVDDVLSTGGTLKAVVTTLKDMGVDILRVLMVFNKMRELESFKEELGVEIIPLLNVFVEGEKL
ncbi:MAG: adenine phosphoribosyltransferase, partial [Thermoplasmata archaeon]|nr:adenine phosphoribosyltransferase [Thermoplasmata archaeon]